ncbi:unnamed protein product, partial [Mesorhabditis spiculigera]
MNVCANRLLSSSTSVNVIDRSRKRRLFAIVLSRTTGVRIVLEPATMPAGARGERSSAAHTFSDDNGISRDALGPQYASASDWCASSLAAWVTAPLEQHDWPVEASASGVGGRPVKIVIERSPLPDDSRRAKQKTPNTESSSPDPQVARAMKASRALLQPRNPLTAAINGLDSTSRLRPHRASAAAFRMQLVHAPRRESETAVKSAPAQNVPPLRNRHLLTLVRFELQEGITQLRAIGPSTRILAIRAIHHDDPECSKLFPKRVEECPQPSCAGPRNSESDAEVQHCSADPGSGRDRRCQRIEAFAWQRPACAARTNCVAPLSGTYVPQPGRHPHLQRALKRSDRTAARRHDQALRLAGYEEWKPTLAVRPNNLLGGTDSARRTLRRLGAPPESAVMEIAHLAPEDDSTIRTLWNSEALLVDIAEAREALTQAQHAWRQSVARRLPVNHLPWAAR